jgi:tetratricopeptide (TPR) repeat protein
MGTQGADELFKAGRFVEAEQRYAEVLRESPEDVQTLTRAGAIALLSNRLDEAQQRLSRAVEIKRRQAWLARAAQRLRKASEQTPEALLGQVFYLRDDYQQAAPFLRTAGWKTLAEKLASFGDSRPYQTEGQAGAVHLKFSMTDPLPVVQVCVNGSEPVNFFIDTGGAEVIIDTEFAKEVGAAQFGIERGMFGGGKIAGFQHGRIDSLTLGDLTVKHIPVTVMDVRRFSDPVFGGQRVDGIIGTFFLYHFLATLDYPAGELILRPKTEQNLRQVEQAVTEHNQIIVPFWMADHYMVAWGTVNGSRPLLWFVDTGLAGAGFTCPQFTLQEAGIDLQGNRVIEGSGGGGKFTSTLFEVQELTLGAAQEQHVQGVYGAFPPQLETAWGFRIGGLISHTFFRPYAFTLDFTNMRYFLDRKS